MTPIGKAVVLVIGLAVLAAFIIALFVKPTPQQGGNLSALYILYKNHAPISETEYATNAAMLVPIGFQPDVPAALDWDCEKQSDNPEIPGHPPQNWRIKVKRDADGRWFTVNPYDTGTPVDRGPGEDGLSAAKGYVSSQG